MIYKAKFRNYICCYAKILKKEINNVYFILQNHILRKMQALKTINKHKSVVFMVSVHTRPRDNEKKIAAMLHPKLSFCKVLEHITDFKRSNNALLLVPSASTCGSGIPPHPQHPHYRDSQSSNRFLEHTGGCRSKSHIYPILFAETGIQWKYIINSWLNTLKIKYNQDVSYSFLKKDHTHGAC